MKKTLILIFIMALFIVNTKIYAVCNDDELTETMSEFLVLISDDENYLNSINEGKEQSDTYDYLLLFTPESDKYNIEVINKTTNKKVDIEYSENYNQYYVGAEFSDEPVKYLVNVYGNENSSCQGELVFSEKYTIPKFNEFSLSEYCDYNKSESICRTYFDIDNIESEEIEKYVSQKKTEKIASQENVLTFIKKNWYFVVIPILIISIIYIVIIRNYKKKVSNR